MTSSSAAPAPTASSGGQDDDVLDGGAGNDVINARGDGGDPDEVVCGPGEDTVLLGKNDRIMVEAGASNDEPEAGDDPETGDDPGEQGDDPGEQGDGEPATTDDVEEPGDDDGCEHVKRPGGPRRATRTSAAAMRATARDAVRAPSAATTPSRPSPEPDEPVDEPERGVGEARLGRRYPPRVDGPHLAGALRDRETTPRRTPWPRTASPSGAASSGACARTCRRRARRSARSSRRRSSSRSTTRPSSGCEETLIYADVGAPTTAKIVERLEMRGRERRPDRAARSCRAGCASCWPRPPASRATRSRSPSIPRSSS